MSLYPNKNKKDPCDWIHVDLINTKFKDYQKEYRRPNYERDIPYNYLMNMWRNLFHDCNFWEFLLHQYKYHIHGHYKYHELIEQRAISKIKFHLNNRKLY